MVVVDPTSVSELVPFKRLTSLIQDQKRLAIAGKPSRWPDRLEAEFHQLDQLSAGLVYAARLDLEYLRDGSRTNRSFAYVVGYDTFIFPRRHESGRPIGRPELALAALGAMRAGDKDAGQVLRRLLRRARPTLTRLA